MHFKDDILLSSSRGNKANDITTKLSHSKPASVSQTDVPSNKKMDMYGFSTEEDSTDGDGTEELESEWEKERKVRQCGSEFVLQCFLVFCIRSKGEQCLMLSTFFTVLVNKITFLYRRP